MWLINQASPAARTALVYITIGALTVIWTIVWFLYLYNNPPVSAGTYYFCGGLLATGLTLTGIGLGTGYIGRSARHADLPPQEIAAAEASELPPAMPIASGTASVVVPEVRTATPPLPISPGIKTQNGALKSVEVGR